MIRAQLTMGLVDDGVRRIFRLDSLNRRLLAVVLQPRSPWFCRDKGEKANEAA